MRNICNWLQSSIDLTNLVSGIKIKNARATSKKKFGPIVRLLNTAGRWDNSLRNQIHTYAHTRNRCYFRFLKYLSCPKILLNDLVSKLRLKVWRKKISRTKLQRVLKSYYVHITNVFFFLKLQVTFTPQEKGKHRVYVYLHGMEVKG